MDDVSSFWCQLKAMLIRNIQIKARKKKKTLTELLLPLYILGIMVLFRTVIPNPHFPEVNEPQSEVNILSLFLKMSSSGNLSVAVVPNTTEVKKFIVEMKATMNESCKTTAAVKYKSYSSENDLIKNYWKNPNQFHFGLIFNGSNPFNGSIKYKLLLNPSWMDGLDLNENYASESVCRELPYFSKPNHQFNNEHNASVSDGLTKPNLSDNCPADYYYKSGFAVLQMIIDFTKMRVSQPNGELKLPNVSVNILPKRAYIADWLVGFRVTIPMYMVTAASQFINFLLILIVGEKEKKIKKGMKVMGLRDSVYWLSWFLIYFGIVLIFSVASTFTLCYMQVFKNTSHVLIFLLTLLYSTSIIIFSFMISPFFDKAKTAGTLGGFAVTLTSMLYFVQVFIDTSSPSLMCALSLLSPAAYALAMDKLLLLDLAGAEVTFSTMWAGPGFTFGHCFVMLAFDIILYSLLVYYLDAVWPSEYGTYRHPLFCLPWRTKNQMEQNLNDTFEMESIPNDDVEEVSDDLKKGEAIKIVGLHKSFSSCRKPTVDALLGIDLMIYENEIIAILGQNGAGKSTLFNILTGLTSPTAGTAYVYNRDVRDSKCMGEIQRMTGVCPQSDILFEDLTVKEHLTFFGKIKGLQHEALKSSIDIVLQDVALEDQVNTMSKMLSGGQKRKLSIAIAIIGDPKVIILDEPTAGVDAYSKRQIWTLLQKIKSSKVILLTTHFMDEADLVADRKAILCRGRLRCCGTSLYLKNKFGNASQLMVQVEDSNRQPVVSQIVRSYVPNAKCSHTFGTEMHFLLPSESMNQFVPLLFFLEKELNSAERRLSITSYNVSMSSLEQVFLELTRDKMTVCGSDKNKININECTHSAEMENVDVTIATGEDEIKLQVECKPSSLSMTRALLRLRSLRMYREPHSFAFMIILPLLFTTCGFYVHKKSITENSKNTNKTLLIQPDIYSNTTKIAVYLEPSLSNETVTWVSQVNSFMQVVKYNGSYSSLLHLTPEPLLGALYVNSCCQADRLSFTIIYNDTMQHSLPIFLNILSNVFYRMFVPIESDNMRNALSLEVEHLPITVLDFSLYTLVSAILMGLTFVLLPITLIADIIYERESKIKHLLHINGLSRSVYFGVNILILNLLLTLVSLLLLLLIFYLNILPIDDHKAHWVLALGLTCYCPSAILCMTCLSYIFNRLQTAQSMLPTLVTWLGIVAFITVIVLDSFGIGLTAHVVMAMTNSMYVPYAMFYFLNQVVEKCHIEYSCVELSFVDFFTHEVLILLFGSLFQIPLWSFILLTIDLQKSGRNHKNMNLTQNGILPQQDVENTDSKDDHEDPDVVAERKKVSKLVSEGKEHIPVALVQNISKEYKRKRQIWDQCRDSIIEDNKLAVSNVSFSVDKGDVFGLLGHNGAGKTTTIKIIIGEDHPTAGVVWVNGSSSLVGNESEMGYCPQHDSLWPNITVREHLEIYAAIRGYPPQHLNSVVDQFLRGLMLSDHSEKDVQDCSGGTRRKLTFAIAMMGDTSMVLLDEPSTGMDALSKRFLWNIIRNSFNHGHRGAILTTHSMEEADALCSRVGIMSRGQLRCIGTTQHLKTRYGGGFILEVKLLSTASKLDFVNLILSTFPDSVLKENVMDRIVFNIPQHSVTSLADVFYLLEQVKSDMGIVLYSFNQANLEQVFLNLAKPESSTLPPPS